MVSVNLFISPSMKFAIEQSAIANGISVSQEVKKRLSDAFNPEHQDLAELAKSKHRVTASICIDQYDKIKLLAVQNSRSMSEEIATLLETSFKHNYWHLRGKQSGKTHIRFLLPNKDYNRLIESRDKHKTNLSEEVRNRLEMSFNVMET